MKVRDRCPVFDDVPLNDAIANIDVGCVTSVVTHSYPRSKLEGETEGRQTTIFGENGSAVCNRKLKTHIHSIKYKSR